MLNSPVFFISREKKYLGLPPRENVKKKTNFSWFFKEIQGTPSEKNYGIQSSESYLFFPLKLQILKKIAKKNKLS